MPPSSVSRPWEGGREEGGRERGREGGILQLATEQFVVPLIVSYFDQRDTKGPRLDVALNLTTDPPDEL